MVETTALLGAANRSELDKIIIPQQPLDILSQQIVAEVSGAEWVCDNLYQVFTSAWPCRDLSREDFAFERLPGSIFQLVNTSYRIQKVEQK